MLTEKMKTAPRPPSQAMSQLAATRPWLAAALWMAFLGPLFFLVYGTYNWLTSQRSDVGTCYFEWERLIPFAFRVAFPVGVLQRRHVTRQLQGSADEIPRLGNGQRLEDSPAGVAGRIAGTEWW